MSPEGAPIGVVAGSSVGCWPVPTCSMGSSFSVPCLPQEAFIPLAVLSISICEIRGSCVAVSCFGAVHGRCVTFVQLSLVKVLLLKAFGECAAPVLSVSPAVPALIAMVVCPAETVPDTTVFMRERGVVCAFSKDSPRAPTTRKQTRLNYAEHASRRRRRGIDNTSSTYPSRTCNALTRADKFMKRSMKKFLAAAIAPGVPKCLKTIPFATPKL